MNKEFLEKKAQAIQIIKQRLLKQAGSILEEESVKGQFKSTPEGKCNYLKRQGASKALVSYYCRDIEEREAKKKKTGKPPVERQDVRKALKKKLSQKQLKNQL